MRDKVLTLILRALPRGSRARTQFCAWWALLDFVPGSVPLGRWRFSLHYTKECKRWPYRLTPECRSSWLNFFGWHLVVVQTRRYNYNNVFQAENDNMVAKFIRDYDRTYA